MRGSQRDVRGRDYVEVLFRKCHIEDRKLSTLNSNHETVKML